MARFLGLGDGSDGVINLSSYTRVGSSCSGTSGATTLTATNASFAAGQRIFIHQSRGTGVGNYEDNRIESYVAGTITLVHPLQNTYTDSGASQAQVVLVKEASGVTGTRNMGSWDGDEGGVFVIACNGVFNATVNGNADGFRGGAGGSTSGDRRGIQGEGSTATGSVSKAANTNAGGGGIDSVGNGTGTAGAGGGGGGGHAGAGSAGEAASGDNLVDGSPGAAGTTIGQAALTSLYLGGAGGGGGTDDSGNGGLGGDGGGVIVIYAREIASTAQITSNGENGQDAQGTQSSGGGGGGAGGSILLKTVKTTIGSSKITATGGTGGTATGGFNNEFGGDGGTGADGRIRIESCSVSGTSDPAASEDTGGHDYCGGGAFIF